MGYGQRAVFQKSKTKAPDETEMYQHQGLAWIPRRGCSTNRTSWHRPTIIDTRFAATVCSALKHLSNLGIPALNRMQDKLAQAIAEAIPREAKRNR
eukprot:1808334-Karenia_brevis.AAC.1